MTDLACACGSVTLEVEGPPILSAECHCTSCRSAAERLDAAVAEPNGGTRFVLQRKDRARIVNGDDQLASFRLNPDAPTQRIAATCCGSLMWLEFKGGHWISVYAARWPNGTAPAPHLRTMVRDAPPGTQLWRGRGPVWPARGTIAHHGARRATGNAIVRRNPQCAHTNCRLHSTHLRGLDPYGVP